MVQQPGHHGLRLPQPPDRSARQRTPLGIASAAPQVRAAVGRAPLQRLPPACTPRRPPSARPGMRACSRAQPRSDEPPAAGPRWRAAGRQTACQGPVKCRNSADPRLRRTRRLISPTKLSRARPRPPPSTPHHAHQRFGRALLLLVRRPRRERARARPRSRRSLGHGRGCRRPSRGVGAPCRPCRRAPPPRWRRFRPSSYCSICLTQPPAGAGHACAGVLNGGSGAPAGSAFGIEGRPGLHVL